MFAGSSVTREGIRSPWPIPCIYTTGVDFPQNPQHRKFEAWQQKSTETPQGYFFIIKHWLFTKLSISDVSLQHPAGMTELSCKDSLSLAAEVYCSYTTVPHRGTTLWDCCEQRKKSQFPWPCQSCRGAGSVSLRTHRIPEFWQEEPSRVFPL